MDLLQHMEAETGIDGLIFIFMQTNIAHIVLIH